MKKVSKNFDVSECSLYKYGSRYLTERPKNTKLKHYLYDDKESIYIGVVRRNLRIPEILLFSIIVINLVLLIIYNKVGHEINITDTIYYKEGVIGLNIMNDKSNADSITVTLSDNGKQLIEPITVEVGKSVGNVEALTELDKGSYLCVLDYTINGEYTSTNKTFEILLIAQ